MYAVTYKNRVVMGPIEWNDDFIVKSMRLRYQEIIEVPTHAPPTEELPLDVNADIRIYPADEDRPRLDNPMIQQYHGPTWDITDTKITARYTVVPLSMADARSNHRDVAAALRWKQEHRGLTINVNGQEFMISTHRSERTKWVELLQSMGDTVNWKFGKTWSVLDRQQVQTIAAAVHTHVQAAFDEELRLNVLIDQAQDHDGLLAIVELQLTPEQRADL